MIVEDLLKCNIDVSDLIIPELKETISGLQAHINEGKVGFFSFDKEEDHELVQELLDAHRKVLQFYTVETV